LKKNEKGFSLIEVVIALLLLGIIGVALLSGLATASIALVIADERATAESLARSQMEYVKNQGYNTAPAGGEVTYAEITAPDGYTIWSVNRAGTTVEDIIGVPWNTQANQPSPTDDGIQKITVTVIHNANNDKEVITLEGYKVNR